MPGRKKIYKLVWLWKWNKDHVQWKIFLPEQQWFALTAHKTVATRSLFARTTETQFLLKFLFCFLFHVLIWTLWSGASPPSRTLHNPHTFFHFILWKRVSVSFLLFFFFFFFKPETLPPWSVPCWLYVRGFSRLNLPLEYCSVHFIQRSVGNHRRSPSAPCFVSPMFESRLSGLVPSQSTDSSVCMRFSSPHR